MTEHFGPTDKPTCVLVLQGGGAMAAYHVGAYRALQEHGFEPDWVCGISMGAINAAVIAGNPSATRLARLDALWDTIAWPDLLPPVEQVALRTWFNVLSTAQALAFGQPAFFSPRPINPYFAPPGPAATSFYDTAPLRPTLERFVDFELLNRAPVRLSVGATDIETGELVFFDNRAMGSRFGPEHVIASGSLPPGFPPTEVAGRFYWDGGCVSNTPLEAVLADTPTGHTVAFVLDLWSAAGPLPRTMNEVLWRIKQIQYASRIAHHVDSVATKTNLRQTMRGRDGADAGEPADPSAPGQRLDIVHLTYHPGEAEIPASDAEFSRASIAARRAAGQADMERALQASPWSKTAPRPQLAAMVHCVSGDSVTTLPEPNLRATSERGVVSFTGDPAGPAPGSAS